MISAKEKKSLQDLLLNSKKIILTTHTNPDGDAIGSSLAMYHYLTKKGFEVTTVVPNQYPDFLDWIPGIRDILIYERQAKKVQKALKEADLIFCLDYNSLKRVGNFSDVLERTTQPKILIDHHINPEVESFVVCISTVKASSTGELVYDFINLMGDVELIDKAIAEAIYTGIVTDTGSFSYAANRGKPYRITADLIKRGINTEQIHRLIYNTFSENRLRLLGFAINDRLTVWDKYHAALIYLTKADLKKYNYKIGDIEGVVNYPLMMDKVNLSILLTEKNNQIRMSFRSKGDFSVNDLARKHFSGGGHRNAAGGKNFLTISETIKLVEKVLVEYEDELNYKLSYS